MISSINSNVLNLLVVLYTNAEDIQDNLQDGNKAPPKLNSLSQTTNIVQPIPTACSNGSFTMAIAILVNQLIRLWHHRYLSDGVNKPISNIQIEESYSHCGLKILVIYKICRNRPSCSQIF